MDSLMFIPKILIRFNRNPSSNLLLTRKLFGSVNIAFNRVEVERLKLVGADRLCAEWILKNGGGVGLTLFTGKYLRDYNSLPPENIKFQIKEIDGTGSSIMAIGFDHLYNCKNIDKIILDQCKHLDNEGLPKLVHVKSTLNYLQISDCPNITDEGLLSLKELTNLKTLIFYKMQYVKNVENVIKELQNSLPSCKITLKD